MTISIDAGKVVGRLRPLHGINKGPLAAGGLVDVTSAQAALAIPLVRLHDCHWPNPDVVDIHVVFPNPDADPARPESYDFRLTDEYLAAIRKTGTQVVYRLGESIEHTRTKRFVHPPPNAARWAAIALGIVRHYNEGWASGFRYGIRYWEIWNEPENRPAMWTGSDQDYFELYRKAAHALKSHDPTLAVGGPAVGYSGRFTGEKFEPSPFVRSFLAFCRRERLPLDFFSWHGYTADLEELPRRARAIREMLDNEGFPRTESHLTEWNYLPGNRWDPISATAQPTARQAFYEEMSGTRGAAFIVATLLRLQDAPVTACALFHGELGGFGLFNEHGIPLTTYHAVDLFHRFLQTPRRVITRGFPPTDLTVEAALSPDGTGVAVLLASMQEKPRRLRFALDGMPWTGAQTLRIHQLDGRSTRPVTTDARLPSGAPIELSLEGPAVVLIEIEPAH